MTLLDMLLKMIDRRVRGGANRKQSEELLKELFASHSGDNLAKALNYEGFATPKFAEKVVQFITQNN